MSLSTSIHDIKTLVLWELSIKLSKPITLSGAS